MSLSSLWRRFVCDLKSWTGADTPVISDLLHRARFMFPCSMLHIKKKKKKILVVFYINVIQVCLVMNRRHPHQNKSLKTQLGYTHSAVGFIEHHTEWKTVFWKFLCIFTCRNSSSNDPCDKPRHGHVLGNIPLEPNGDNGEIQCRQQSK